MQRVADLNALGNHAGEATQRTTLAEDAHHNVAGMHGHHATVGILERVVGALVVEHANHHECARGGGDLAGEDHVVVQGHIARRGSDLVDSDPHGTSDERDGRETERRRR